MDRYLLSSEGGLKRNSLRENWALPGGIKLLAQSAIGSNSIDTAYGHQRIVW
jgi:hypothetical protein